MSTPLKQQQGKSLGVILAAAALIVLSLILPLPDGLSRAGLSALMLLAAGVLLWITEVIPLVITTFLLMIAMPYLGIMELPDVWTSFTGSTFFFVMATFAITAALVNTPIPSRIAAFLINWSGEKSGKLVFGFTAGTALLSSIMSNVPTCALFMSLGLSMIKTAEETGSPTKKLAKCLMIGIPFGAVAGGFATPAGSPNNILAISLLEGASDLTISFLGWMVVGVPIAILTVVICAFWLVMAFRPEPINEKTSEAARKSLAEIGPMTLKEKKVLGIIIVTFILWISGTWISAFNTTVVALIAMAAFFFPGIRVITWKDYVNNAGWEVLFMIGGVQALAAGLTKSGAISWLVDNLLKDAANWPAVVTFMAVSALVCILHICIPSGPAVAAITIAPMVAVAMTSGVNVIALVLVTAFWCNVTLILPFDAVALMTYGQGHYSIKDIAKGGSVPTVVLVVLIALIIPLLAMPISG